MTTDDKSCNDLVGLTDWQAEVLTKLAELEAELNRGVTMEQLGEAIGRTPPAAHDVVKRLLAKGYVEQTKPGGHGAYRVLCTADRRAFDRAVANEEAVLARRRARLAKS